MFGWFAPKCPLDTWEKTWTERRMRWLADQFGIDRLLNAKVILPTEQYFASPLGTDLKSVRRLLDRMCGYMGVSPAKVSLEIVADEQMPGAAGLYQQRKRSIICVARSQLANPVSLLATLCHELAHELLLGGGLLTTQVSDHEWITDLLPVFLGTGIFLANSTIHDTSGYSSGWSWWSISRQGYLPSRIFGYAFALFAFVRGETDPSWAEHLRLDARASLHAGLRYLRKTGDCLFHPNTIREKIPPLTSAGAVELLRTGTPTVRLATLWDVRDADLTEPGVLAVVQACLNDRDAHVIAEAARTLALFGPAAEGAIPRLLDALWRGENSIKIGAAEALGAIRSRPETVVRELTVLLTDGSPELVVAAARALHRFGRQAASAVPKLLAALKPALVEGWPEPGRSLVALLQLVSDNPREILCDHFEDLELRRLALKILRQQEREGK
ncbi:MAG TPA: HEAT repeat domain-containing protein [Gemmataceae bacterium]